MRKVATILFGLMLALAANSSSAQPAANAENTRSANAEVKTAKVSAPENESERAWLPVSAAALVLLIVQRGLARRG